MSILHWIEQVVKYIPKLFKLDTWVAIVLNSFNHREFFFLDPVYKLLWTTLLVNNLINFFIKEVAFYFLDYPFEFILVFQLFWLSVLIQILLTVIIPSSFGMIFDVNFPRVLMPYVVNICSEGIYNPFEHIAIKNWICLEIFNKVYQFFNKAIFLLTIPSKDSFCCLDVFLSYWYINRDRGMIRGKSSIQVDMMIVLLCQIGLKEDKI